MSDVCSSYLPGGRRHTRHRGPKAGGERMPGPWNTPAELERAAAAALKLSGGRDALDPNWLESLATYGLTSYNVICSVLVGRGYTVAQLDTWGARKDFERETARYFAQLNGAFDRVESFPALEARKIWLDWLMAPNLVLLDGTGLEITPGGDVMALVGFGALDTRRDPIVFNEPGRRNP